MYPNGEHNPYDRFFTPRMHPPNEGIGFDQDRFGRGFDDRTQSMPRGRLMDLNMDRPIDSRLPPMDSWNNPASVRSDSWVPRPQPLMLGSVSSYSPISESSRRDASGRLLDMFSDRPGRVPASLPLSTESRGYRRSLSPQRRTPPRRPPSPSWKNIHRPVAPGRPDILNPNARGSKMASSTRGRGREGPAMNSKSTTASNKPAIAKKYNGPSIIEKGKSEEAKEINGPKKTENEKSDEAKNINGPQKVERDKSEEPAKKSDVKPVMTAPADVQKSPSKTNDVANRSIAPASNSTGSKCLPSTSPAPVAKSSTGSKSTPSSSPAPVAKSTVPPMVPEKPATSEKKTSPTKDSSFLVETITDSVDNVGTARTTNVEEQYEYEYEEIEDEKKSSKSEEGKAKESQESVPPTSEEAEAVGEIKAEEDSNTTKADNKPKIIADAKFEDIHFFHLKGKRAAPLPPTIPPKSYKPIISNPVERKHHSDDSWHNQYNTRVSQFKEKVQQQGGYYGTNPYLSRGGRSPPGSRRMPPRSAPDAGYYYDDGLRSREGYYREPQPPPSAHYREVERDRRPPPHSELSTPSFFGRDAHSSSFTDRRRSPDPYSYPSYDGRMPRSRSPIRGYGSIPPAAYSDNTPESYGSSRRAPHYGREAEHSPQKRSPLPPQDFFDNRNRPVYQRDYNDHPSLLSDRLISQQYVERNARYMPEQSPVPKRAKNDFIPREEPPMTKEESVLLLHRTATGLVNPQDFVEDLSDSDDWNEVVALVQKSGPGKTSATATSKETERPWKQGLLGQMPKSSADVPSRGREGLLSSSPIANPKRPLPDDVLGSQRHRVYDDEYDNRAGRAVPPKGQSSYDEFLDRCSRSDELSRGGQAVSQHRSSWRDSSHPSSRHDDTYRDQRGGSGSQISDNRGQAELGVRDRPCDNAASERNNFFR